MLCRLPQAAEGHLKWEDKNGGLSGVQPPYSRLWTPESKAMTGMAAMLTTLCENMLYSLQFHGDHAP